MGQGRHTLRSISDPVYPPVTSGLIDVSFVVSLTIITKGVRQLLGISCTGACCLLLWGICGLARPSCKTFP